MDNSVRLRPPFFKMQRCVILFGCVSHVSFLFPQQTTRQMQSLCAHGKDIGDASMSKEAPAVKKLLEEFIFRSDKISLVFSPLLSGGFSILLYTRNIVNLIYALILRSLVGHEGYFRWFLHVEGRVNQYPST